jgi:long-chain acyl-CoA synthetase
LIKNYLTTLNHNHPGVPVQTIDQLIQQSCQHQGEKIALQHKNHGQWQGITYRKLWESVEKLASGLHELSIDKNTHIALLGPSSPRWITAYLAILRCGCVAVPVDKELKAAELRYILHDADVQAIFINQFQFETLLEIIDDLPKLKIIILLDTPLSDLSDRSDIAGVLEKLSTLWQKLVKDLSIPDERRKEIEGVTMQAYTFLAQPDEHEKDKGKSVNFLSRAETSRNKLIKEKRLYAYKMLFSKTQLPTINSDPEQRAVILYTSGTTGRPKGAMLSHRNIVSNIKSASARFALDSSIETLSFLPINHVFEQVCGVLLPLSLGGKVSFAESIKKLADNLNEIKPTFLLAVPAVYRKLLERIMKNIESKPASRMLFRFPLTRRVVTRKVQQTVGIGTTFISGGAALDPAIAAGFQALGLNLLQGYGITETAPVISAESPFKSKPGTVGEALDGVEIRINQPNANGEGEILVKGPNVMLGYYQNKKATAEVLKDGWYYTGDLGCFDEDGMLVICGRVKNLIVTANGKNVYPEEIENHLLQSPFIAEIMVYGHKVTATAEEVYAIIFPDEEALFALAKEQNSGPLTAADIEALIREEVLTYGKNLADYKRVKKFSLREDEFPKTTTKKIKRYVVAAEITTE